MGGTVMLSLDSASAHALIMRGIALPRAAKTRDSAQRACGAMGSTLPVLRLALLMSRMSAYVKG